MEEGEILELSLQDEQGEQVPSKTFIAPDERTMSVQVPNGTDLSALVPEFKVMEVQYQQPVDHHHNVKLQILDLAAVADDIAEPAWWVTDAENPGNLVRWSQSLTETTGEMLVQANFSGEPLSGPVAIKYGGATKDYRIHVKKVMLFFE